MLLALLALGCGPEAPPSPPRSGPPNIVMILSDDHGYGDYGFMGSQIARTPHIDELAEQGSVFPLTYNTASICRPSQISLLTGLDPLQWESTLRVIKKREQKYRGLDRIRRFATLARVLGQRGYRSLQAGKLWEGSYDQAGFDAGQKEEVSVGVHDLPAWSGGPKSHAVGRTTMAPVYDFIDEHLDDRFFVWFAPMLPHVPFDAPERYARRYANSDLPKDARGYYANIERLDDVVGGLVEHLERQGIRRDTLIVFLADNGWEIETAQEERRKRIWVGGVRGKASMYEQGWRTPLVFNWPGQIPSGARHETLASSLDVFQTLLDYGGMLPLEERPGVSLRPVLEGGDPRLRDALVGSDAGIRPRGGPRQDDGSGPRPPAYFVRDASWHYIWNSETDEEELFAITEDPDEVHNVVGEHPERARAYRERIDAWAERMRQPVNPIPALNRAPARPPEPSET